MKEWRVAGADYSGAKQVLNETWLAAGKVDSLGLTIDYIKKVGASSLAAELSAASSQDVPLVCAGLDFPFSLPTDFIQFLCEKKSTAECQEWQQVAELIVFMSQDEFINLVGEFAKESKRFTDASVQPIAQSPLHRGNPSMVQMTYNGMRMLASLPPDKFAVLPFQDKAADKCSILEVYPRATLNNLGLPSTGYKSKDKPKSAQALAAREAILKGLLELREKHGATHKDCPRLTLEPKLRTVALESADALDAIVACYTAAAWGAAPGLFKDPFAADDWRVIVEGWIYCPEVGQQQV